MGDEEHDWIAEEEARELAIWDAWELWAAKEPKESTHE